VAVSDAAQHGTQIRSMFDVSFRNLVRFRFYGPTLPAGPRRYYQMIAVPTFRKFLDSHSARQRGVWRTIITDD